MKISKLFHWLYACLMLLPVFAIGVTCLYAIFNDNAKDSYDFSVNEELMPIYYESNEVNNASDLIPQHIYYYTDNIVEELSYLQYSIFVNKDLFIQQFNQYSSLDIDNVSIYTSGSNNIYHIYYRIVHSNGTSYLNIDSLPSYFIVESVVNPNNIPQVLINHIEETNYKYVKEYYVYSEETTLDNVFYDSVNEVGLNPYFAWANDSFLATPVQFITDLFGLPANSSIITMLSYWLAISIIYLCFDVVMYVPLLAHRWLDKGMLE